MPQWKPDETICDNRFLIEEVLGGGGFGIAYRAHDLSANQQVVIKTLNQQQQEGANFKAQQVKFLNEARVLSGLRHPHIVHVNELIQEADLWGIVMEYIPGRELAECVEDGQRLPEAQALRYIKQVGEALTYMHEQGVLHRDIKPTNIMLRRGDQEAVLIDFGIAKELIVNRKRSSVVPRTDGYAPIEQYDPKQGEIGFHTDVYALAATLYHVLTGASPLPANFRSPGDKPPSPRSKNPLVSEVVEAGVMKGLELLPDDRPRSMQEFLVLLGVSQPSKSLPHDPVTQTKPTVEATPPPKHQHPGNEVPLSSPLPVVKVIESEIIQGNLGLKTRRDFLLFLRSKFMLFTGLASLSAFGIVVL